MSRKDPDFSPPEVKLRSDSNIIVQKRKYELITPLFGGGVKTMEADPVTIIRGSSIRGQLRFWWRATRGGQFNGDLQKMKEAEDLLWGAASTETAPRPSMVQIEVSIDYEGKPDAPFEVINKPDKQGRPKRVVQPRPDSTAPAYAVFPLQPSEEDAQIGGVGMTTKSIRTDIRFTLKLSLEKDGEDRNLTEVEAALWAWETFGGIGGRTRRGLGALKCTSISDKAVPLLKREAVETNLHKSLQHHVLEGIWPPNVPYVDRQGRNIKVVNRNGNVLQVWQALIVALRNFRQARYGKMGKSKWPEANEIRRRAGLPPKLADNKTTNDLVEKFPRALFGLPIVFHMAHDPSLKKLTLSLQGANNIQRLASPLILRPLECTGGAVGLAVILSTTSVPPDGLSLEGIPLSGDQPDANLTKNEARKIDPLDGNPDVLQAFLNTL